MLHFPRNFEEGNFRSTLIQNVAEQAVNLSSTHGVCLSLPLDVPGLYRVYYSCSVKNFFWRFSIHDEITGIP